VIVWTARERLAQAFGLAVFAVALAGCQPAEPLAAPSLEESAGALLLRELSDVEREVLADRFVSASEHEKSEVVVRQCLEGYELEVSIEPDGRISVETSDFDEAEVERLFNECWVEVDAIREVWRLQNQPSPEQIAHAERGFVDCVADLGYVNTGASFGEASAAYSQNVLQVREEWDTSTKAENGTPNPLDACFLAYTEAVGVLPLPGLAEALAALNVS